MISFLYQQQWPAGHYSRLRNCSFGKSLQSFTLNILVLRHQVFCSIISLKSINLEPYRRTGSTVILKKIKSGKCRDYAVHLILMSILLFLAGIVNQRKNKTNTDTLVIYISNRDFSLKVFLHLARIIIPYWSSSFTSYLFSRCGRSWLFTISNPL